jgi:hypothetical protein
MQPVNGSPTPEAGSLLEPLSSTPSLVSTGGGFSLTMLSWQPCFLGNHVFLYPFVATLQPSTEGDGVVEHLRTETPAPTQCENRTDFQNILGVETDLKNWKKESA